jgi:hypothetical protein
LSGSLSANLLLRYRYGNAFETDEATRLMEIISAGDPDPARQDAFNRASATVSRDLEHFKTVWRPAKPVPFPFSGFDYDLRRDGHDVEWQIPSDDSDRPLVSVITRTHGPKTSFLREALVSVINQTYRNVEHIIVEDRTDFAQELVEQAAEVYGRNIRYLKSPGEGRSDGGNFGLASASGRYLMFLDNDDLLFADHIETLMARLLDNPAAVAAYALAWDVQTRYQGDDSYTENYPFIPDLHKQGHKPEVLEIMNYIPIQSIVFCRELYEKYGGFDTELDYLEDWNLWVRYSRGGEFCYVPKVTSIYRTPANPEMRNQRQVKLDESYERARRKNRK